MSRFILTDIASNPATPSSGLTKVFANTNKKMMAIDDAGLTSALGFSTSVFSSPANPTGTASLTGVMMGLAGSITPQTTGNIVIAITGTHANDTGGTNTIQVRHGTGAAPANGDALTGTIDGANVVSVTGTLRKAWGAMVKVTGLTVGTAYWIDVSLKVSTGTGTINSVDIVAFEF